MSVSELTASTFPIVRYTLLVLLLLLVEGDELVRAILRATRASCEWCERWRTLARWRRAISSWQLRENRL